MFRSAYEEPFQAIRKVVVTISSSRPTTGPEADLLEAGLQVIETTLMFFERFVLAQEKQADMLMYSAKAAEKVAGLR